MGEWERCRDCKWYLKEGEVGCLIYGQNGRDFEIEKIKQTLETGKCDNFERVME